MFRSQPSTTSRSRAEEEASHVGPIRTDREARAENRQRVAVGADVHSATNQASAQLKDKSAPSATRLDTTLASVEAEDDLQHPSTEAVEATVAEDEVAEEDGTATERTVSTLPRAAVKLTQVHLAAK